jgi:S1-C subfamily serine protease
VIGVGIAINGAALALVGAPETPKRAAHPQAIVKLPPLPPVLRPQNPAWFGVGVRPISPARARRFHLPAMLGGVEVVSIAPNSPASRLPLEVATPTKLGDVIFSVDDYPVPSQRALRSALERHRPGQLALLSIVQPGQVNQSINVSIRLDGRPDGADAFQ